MKTIPKLIKRLIRILLSSFILLVVLNIIVFVIITLNLSNNGSPWQNAKDTADLLNKYGNEVICTDASLPEQLEDQKIWAFYIDNNSRTMIWHTDNIPSSITGPFDISAISSMTRGYIDGYPTFTSSAGPDDQDLLVLGYPKDSYWKLLYPAWDYNLIAHLPQIILVTLICNLILIILIYSFTNAHLIRSVNPIVQGIQKLATKQPVTLDEKGVLSELSSNINHTSRILIEQEKLLEKKDTARANWIAGVSHDIRTPLAMVIGYASQLENSTTIDPNSSQKAAAIVRQSERIKNLVNDLNLASKLEYNMQPLNRTTFNLISLLRQIVVDFMNNDINQEYPIEWLTDDQFNYCMVNADASLYKRAISNLIQNSMNHNQDGCTIYVTVKKAEQNICNYDNGTSDSDHMSAHNCIITIEDNGVGASLDQIDKMNHAAHYMVCDTATTSQRHGLGILIVKQIITAHHGSVEISQSQHGGLKTQLIIPYLSKSNPIQPDISH